MLQVLVVPCLWSRARGARNSRRTSDGTGQAAEPAGARTHSHAHKPHLPSRLRAIYCRPVRRRPGPGGSPSSSTGCRLCRGSHIPNVRRHEVCRLRQALRWLLKPSQAKPSQAKSSQVKPSQVKSSQAKPSQGKSNHVESSRVESVASRGVPRRAESSRVEPSRAESSRVEPSRAESSQVKSGL